MWNVIHSVHVIYTFGVCYNSLHTFTLFTDAVGATVGTVIGIIIIIIIIIIIVIVIFRKYRHSGMSLVKGSDVFKCFHSYVNRFRVLFFNMADKMNNSNTGIVMEVRVSQCKRLTASVISAHGY